MIDPSEYTPAERALVDKAKQLIERYELDYGNSVNNLNDDQEYFGSQYLAILHPEQSNETIAVIRWMEEDLRHWLRDNDWPVTEENMDAMRGMISGRALQDRSIEKGWEIIDAMVDEGRLSREKEPEDDGEEASASYDPTNPADPLHETDPDSKAIRF